MSQAKVDKHKELKKNKKKIVKRQKINRFMWAILGTVITVALVAFVVYSGYRSYEEAHADDPLPTVEVDLSSVTDYETALNSEADTDEAADATEEEASDETEGTEEESEDTTSEEPVE